MASARKVLIMGAAGRDFHNFNCVYRNNDAFRVVAFTATQIPDIAGRKYPAELAGRLYPDGIPIHDEADTVRLVREHGVDDVVFAYSDVSNQYVMERAARANAAGANFVLLGSRDTMLVSKKPVIGVCAVRTGSGKSQTSRFVAGVLRAMGRKVAVVRHPMPYGDLAKQAVQRFATFDDLAAHDCTIEEREEYEPHVEKGSVVFAGVDYHAILKAAEAEADVILWDGGNNDLPFYKPSLFVTVADPLRPGHERTYHPGAANFLAADVIVINKVDSADAAGLDAVRRSAAELNPGAAVVEAASEITTDQPAAIRGKKVLVVEDGPTLTHGGMHIGAGWVLATREGAGEIVDARPYAVGSIRDTYTKYPHVQTILPAMGYSERQVRELEQTIAAVPADVIVVGTPIDLGRLVRDARPMVRVRYELKQVAGPALEGLVARVV
ncbi:MAG: GTPase [Deltaproteobacteria bacterium]|nr:GTPase [Deltaproteobacteria bacterium]